MHLVSTVDPPTADASALRLALSIAPLARFTRGLFATGLVEDVQSGAEFTLLAPTNEAFDAMPWSFDALLFDDRFLEARFDLFEYLVIRGRAGALGPRTSHLTVHGQTVRLGKQLAYGRFGAARVLQTIESGPITVHVLEQNVFPWDPKAFLAAAARSSG